LFPDPFPVPDNIWHSFLKTKKIEQNLAFSLSEARYFPESFFLFFDFFIKFYVGSGSKSGFGTGTVIYSGTSSAEAVTDPQETFILRKAKLLCDFSTV
jgi:hypothetical protein